MTIHAIRFTIFPFPKSPIMHYSVTRFIKFISADGITYSFGIVVKALLNGFEGSSRAEVSFIPSILVGVTLGAGPIASSLTNRFGCRAVTIMGAVIAALGLACSAAATSILFLYISVGLVTGKLHNSISFVRSQSF